METGDGLRVLVVDDDRASRVTTTRRLVESGFAATAANQAYEALDRLTESMWDVVVTDLRMPGMDGLELLKAIREEHPHVDVIVMTAYGTIKTAVEALKQGASDYLTKPFHFHELEHRLRTLERLRAQHRELDSLRALLDSPGEPPCGLVGGSPAMRRVIEQVQSFSQHSAPVLVHGETGTGKEVVSRAIHRLGRRAQRPFVAVACGAIPDQLAESELLGHEKGAFTGATNQRFGAFERADGGTLLLDDLDDMPLHLQVKLLRVLEEGTYLRVGGSREIKVDVRVVATTKTDLGQACDEGRFRTDLYYRLRALEMRLPPLRDRGTDILLLAEHFLRRLAANGTSYTLGSEAARRLMRFSWPGNVRELRHAMESVLAACPGGTIEVDHLPEFLTVANGDGEGDLFTLHLGDCETIRLSDATREFEQALIQWAMRKAGGKQIRAAELLNVPRTTLQSKLDKS